jgi:OOP family OmpA-OmpF porin
MNEDKIETAAGIPGESQRSINLPIHFQRDSGYLTAEAMGILDTVVCPALLDEALKNAVFEVVGHTDDIGNLEANMYISRLRAHAVKTYLVTRCNISPGKLDLVSLGPAQPLVPNISEENRKINRRVELRRID